MQKSVMDEVFPERSISDSIPVSLIYFAHSLGTPRKTKALKKHSSMKEPFNWQHR